jgi:exosortase D (VPLPA-CTERM-specific)
MASTPETSSVASAPATAAPAWLWLGAGLILSILVARDGFYLMAGAWFARPEYSHGILIPFVAGYLIWQRRASLGIDRAAGSWLGPVVVMLGLVLWLLGALSTIRAVNQYALIVMFYGVMLAMVGPRAFAKLWAPMLMLLLMVPLPGFFYNNLSLQLQLISSAFGVWLMRLFGISVYLSGNVIDLGHFQMQVVEACDGLRYLFPLMTLGFIVAYFFRAPLWQRILVFLSSVPITIFMNSARIAMIGVFADNGNTALANGLLHELQGWVIFMASGALLLAETWLLVKLFARNASWRDLLTLDFPAARSVGLAVSRVRAPASLVAAAIVLGAAAIASFLMPTRIEAHPARSWFVDFPTKLGDWSGRQGKIEDNYLEFLKLDDYLLADFTNGKDVVNLYSAYYASQRQGESVHSPRSCMPAGGWRITKLEQITIPAEGRARGLRVNRALIELGNDRQLVYYWFKQRDRVLTNEYVVKWYIFVDALTRQRTDGALVRLITPLRPGEDADAGDARLQVFARVAEPELRSFLPD